MWQHVIFYELAASSAADISRSFNAAAAAMLGVQAMQACLEFNYSGMIMAFLL
jgi:hypothetical protein